MKKETKDMKGMVDELEIKLEEIFVGKLWTLPKNIKEIIVKISPYIAVIGLVALIPLVLTLFGLSFLTPVAFLGGVRFGFTYIISVVFALILGILAISTIPGLFKRERKAWKILFWMSLINAVGELLRMDLGQLVIGTALSWYVLFQIKEYYKN